MRSALKSAAATTMGTVIASPHATSPSAPPRRSATGRFGEVTWCWPKIARQLAAPVPTTVRATTRVVARLVLSAMPSVATAGSSCSKPPSGVERSRSGAGARMASGSTDQKTASGPGPRQLHSGVSALRCSAEAPLSPISPSERTRSPALSATTPAPASAAKRSEPPLILATSPIP